jgi:Leucine-rich repeat (LRR) protein
LFFLEEFPPFCGIDYLKIKKLDLSHNKIEIFPSLILYIKDLEELNLSHNKIEEVSKLHNIDSLKIKKFDLSYNKIRTFPCIAVKMSDLEDLNLKGNEIKKTLGRVDNYFNKIKDAAI